MVGWDIELELHTLCLENIRAANAYLTEERFQTNVDIITGMPLPLWKMMSSPSMITFIKSI